MNGGGWRDQQAPKECTDTLILQMNVTGVCWQCVRNVIVVERPEEKKKVMWLDEGGGRKRGVKQKKELKLPGRGREERDARFGLAAA